MARVDVSRRADGAVLRLSLADPPRNILDAAALRELTAAIDALDLAGADRGLKAILLTAEGPNYSVGASVAEHAPAEAPAMLATFGTAIRALWRPDLPIVAAVRGHCLGGGLEVVTLATHIVAHAAAKLGQPEIRLSAFAPVASVLLPRRLGQGRAEALLSTGRVVDAGEALRLGLVDEVTDEDPEARALAFIQTQLQPHSAAALRIACRAARTMIAAELDSVLPRLEALYRDQLLATHDAAEGVRAFLEKRPPKWEDR